MSLARLVIMAVVVEGRSKSAVAREYGISRYWVQQLVHRSQREGPAAFEPRSRRPHSSPRAVDLEVEDLIVRLRKTLTRKGVDAGAETIAAHLEADGISPVPAVSTIWRILSRRGFVVTQPQKRPRSSWKRFAADQPNERWQADITHWRLADRTEVEILNVIDDHSRLCMASVARRVTTGGQVWATFAAAFTRYGVPAEVLTDNGAVFTAKQRGQGRVALEVQLSGSAEFASATPGPTIRRPAARWSGSTRPRRNGWPPSLPPPRWPGCNASWTGSPATTTPSGRTGH
jgi:transposase InsO family protein